ncbi:MAG: metal-dependent hydrolase [archaeon]|nr:metal-dependent hydrolase [archaeon]MCP8306736.1 metal-dependent hydrolase [archaeon]
MPEPLIHFAVPFASLYMVGVRSRMVLAASVFALLPDLDVLLNVHKSITHSILLLFLASFITYSLLRKKYGELILICSLGFASHLLLDLFSGYTPILWPLWDRSVWISIGLNAQFGNPFILAPKADILTAPISFEPFQHLDAEVITSEGIMISLILLGPTILLFLKKYVSQHKNSRSLEMIRSPDS